LLCREEVRLVTQRKWIEVLTALLLFAAAFFTYLAK